MSSDPVADAPARRERAAHYRCYQAAPLLQVHVSSTAKRTRPEDGALTSRRSKWAEIAMRQAEVSTPFPKPGLRHYIERDPAAALPAPMPYDELAPEDRNPWSWFPWVSPDMNEPHEETYIAVNPAPDYSAIEDTFVPPVVGTVKASPSDGAAPGLAGMWGALKRKFAFAG